MTKKENVDLAIGSGILAIGAIGLIATVAKAQGCQPPTGGCPPGSAFDPASCQCVPSGGQTYTVDFVVEGPDGPIANAVGLLGSTPAYSDSGGNMSFAGVAAGTYLFSVSASGYVDVSEQIGVSASQTSFTVTMKLCAPPAGGCQCGSVFSGSACVCVPQNPVSLDVPSSVPFTQNWFVAGDVLRKTVIAGVMASAGCPGGCSPPPPSPGTLAYTVGGTVRDANGAPVCGVKVSASLGSLQSSLWSLSVSGYTWTGYFTYSLRSPTATTDANGDFEFEVDITIVVDRSSVEISIFCTPCSCTGSTNQTFPIALYTTVSSSVRSVTSLAMSSLICGYGVD